jgi:hypothetical protein
MKSTIAIFFKSLHLVFCIFFLCSGYGQITSKKIFGKVVQLSKQKEKKGLNRCATVEYEQYLLEKNPKRRTNTQFEKWIAPLIAEQKAIRAQSKVGATLITIPVVVHVIHNGEAIGTAPNISDAQVQSQITVLNQDFRKKLGTRGYNNNSVGADIEIEFVLAKQDPDGNPTNGIDRVNMGHKTWPKDDVDELVKPATIWDPLFYMNMWSVRFPDTSDVLGYAQFPDSSSLAGIDNINGISDTDGVVASYDVFGSDDYGSGFLINKTYNKGRTMTHEVGHYLGLLHIWGDGNGDEESNSPDCNATDYCEDTPQAGWLHRSCNAIYDTCPQSPGNDMPENYMDYTADTCMNIFTQNQKERMIAVMNKSPRRASLKTSVKGNTIPLFANDAKLKIVADYTSSESLDCGSLNKQKNKQITLTNVGTTTLTSVTIIYNLGSGANQTQAWTGSLAPFQATNVTLLNTNKNGILNAAIDLVNGQTDQRTTNDKATIAFAPMNYEFKNYVFNLQLDKFGSETNWNIKNGSGNILYSGGPYPDSNNLPPVLTQNWTLDADECYTFTINDSKENGICCNSGQGYYNIKSPNGVVKITTGSQFTDTDSVSFTTATLKRNIFDIANEIHWYPNPATTSLKLDIPEGYGLPDNVLISNTSGQIVSQKEVFDPSDLVINVSSLSNGIYFITINKGDRTKTMKFLKE